MSGESNNHNSSVKKAFNLLELFSNSKSQWGVRELARKIGAHESTTYRMMSTLESLGVLYKNPDNDKYALGLKLYDLGKRVKVYDSLVKLSHPELEKVADEIEETVHLGIWNKNEVLMIDKVEGEKGLRLDSRIGQSSPVYCTGLGKALLAFRYSDLLDEIYSKNDLKQFTPYTILDKDELLSELEGIRINEYAVDRQEFELGLICVSVPVFNNEGHVVAALSAAGPSVRFKEDQLLEYVTLLKSGADAITNKIGNYKN